MRCLEQQSGYMATEAFARSTATAVFWETQLSNSLQGDLWTP